MVWKGWEVIHIEVMKKSDVHDITKAIEILRAKFKVPKSKSLVDADGIGAGAVSSGGYAGFHGGASAKKQQGVPENYDNFKTQCYYLLSDKVNSFDLRINVNNECCVIDGERSTKIKLGQKVADIRDLIRDDLRAIKRIADKQDMKKKINTKEEQKIILGRSPDFGDTLMMRCFFDFAPKSVYL